MIYHGIAALIARLPLPLSRRIVSGAGKVDKASLEKPLQLLVDISEVIRHDARTGIQRVLRGIVPQLMKHPPGGYRVCPVFAEKKKGYCYAAVTADCLQADDRLRHAGRPVVVNAGDIFLGLDLAAHLLPRHQGQLLQWKLSGAKFCFLVYDLLPMLQPRWFNPKRHKTFKRWLRTLALYGDDLICISESVKADLQHWLTTQYGLSESTLGLHTIPLGADIASTAPTTGISSGELVLMERFCRNPFVLMVGTLEPRKGYAQALDAFEQLWGTEQGRALVITGKPGWNTENLQARLRTHPEKDKRLFWFDNASDELLQELYRSAAGVLLASEAEGYGLPLIEAAHHGKPVLARDIPVFREIAGPNTSFFNTGSFVESLQLWIQLIQNGKPGYCPLPQSSWADCTASLVEIALSKK